MTNENRKTHTECGCRIAHLTRCLWFSVCGKQWSFCSISLLYRSRHAVVVVGVRPEVKWVKISITQKSYTQLQGSDRHLFILPNSIKPLTQWRKKILQRHIFCSYAQSRSFILQLCPSVEIKFLSTCILGQSLCWLSIVCWVSHQKNLSVFESFVSAKMQDWADHFTQGPEMSGPNVWCIGKKVDWYWGGHRMPSLFAKVIWYIFV